MSIPALREGDAGLKEGDIIDFMNDLDQRNSGYIDLQMIKQRLDSGIHDQRCRITLKSKVKEVCNENIVEQGEQKHVILPQKDVEKPRTFFKTAFDICCGL